jgi:hypothetical protein
MSEQPTTTATDSGEFDAEIAKLELQATRERFVSSRVQEAAAEDEQARRLKVLERWDACGAGDLPLPNSPEEYQALPLDRQMKIEAADPELAGMLSPAVPLPGGCELRMAKGLDFLLPEDVPHLLAAHRGDLVAQLRQRHQEQLWAAHEAAAQQQPTAEQIAQEWQERQAASEESHNAQMKAAWVRRMHQGIA